jgi:hypothetical protein
MFVVTKRDAAAIRTAFDQGGELPAAVELRRLFPGITDSDQARPLASGAVAICVGICLAQSPVERAYWIRQRGQSAR